MRQPRLLEKSLGFEGANLVCVAQRQSDVVETVEQAVFAKALDLKRQRDAIGLDDDLTLQINRQLVADEGRDLVE